MMKFGTSSKAETVIFGALMGCALFIVANLCVTMERLSSPQNLQRIAARFEPAGTTNVALAEIPASERQTNAHTGNIRSKASLGKPHAHLHFWKFSF